MNHAQERFIEGVPRIIVASTKTCGNRFRRKHKLTKDMCTIFTFDEWRDVRCYLQGWCDDGKIIVTAPPRRVLRLPQQMNDAIGQAQTLNPRIRIMYRGVENAI